MDHVGGLLVQSVGHQVAQGAATCCSSPLIPSFLCHAGLALPFRFHDSPTEVDPVIWTGPMWD